MKHIFKNDLILIYLITIFYISSLIFTGLNFDNLINDYIFFPLIFLFSGYSLLAIIYYKDTTKALLKKIILLLELSILLTISMSLILNYSSWGMELKYLMIILAFLTLIFSIVAFIGRIMHLRLLNKDNKELKSLKSKKTPLLKRDSLFITNDMILIGIFFVVMILILLSPEKTSLWKILFWIPGSLIVMFIPGYLLMAYLIPKKGEIENIERLALIWGFSLVITSLIGLIINFTSQGIDITTLIFYLTIFSIILYFIVLIKWRKVAEKDRFNMPKINKILSIIILSSIILGIVTAMQIALT